MIKINKEIKSITNLIEDFVRSHYKIINISNFSYSEYTDCYSFSFTHIDNDNITSKGGYFPYMNLLHINYYDKDGKMITQKFDIDFN